MKYLFLILFLNSFPMLSIGQIRKAADMQLSSGFHTIVTGTNQIIIKTHDSLSYALQKAQYLLQASGYEIEEATPFMLTTKGKFFGMRNSQGSKKGKAEPAVPINFRLRIRAFRLATGTQLQLVGVYVKENDQCTPHCRGIGMQAYEDNVPAIRRDYWAEACFSDAFEVIRKYTPGSIGVGLLYPYGTVGSDVW